MVLDYPFTEAEAKVAWEVWGCNCGPTALAFALQLHLDRVRPLIPDFEARRYTTPTMMKAALSNAGVRYTAVAAAEANMYADRMALVRLQWTGPWTETGVNPKWAYRATHWIATWEDMEERGVLGEMQILKMVFDCNGGMREAAEWEEKIVPLILKQVPRADGGWHPTHIWRINRGK